MGSVVRLCVAFAALVASVGCVNGAIFTRTVRPLDLNLRDTPVFDRMASSRANTLQYYVRIDWGSFGTGDVAQRYGFSEIHYADLERLSILGFFTRRTVHVYGERAAP